MWYVAVLIANADPVVAVLTILVIVPDPLILGSIFAPTRGAYPRPVEEPKEIIIPPLGIWFWFTSNSEVIIISEFELVIPENTTLDIPEFSIILKLFAGLFKVVGVWKTPFMNKIPFPPVVPNPTVFAPPTVNVNVLPIPVNWDEISSYIWFEV